MESIVSTFHIDWKVIIAQMFNFGVVFVVLYIYALKPLSKLMKEREEKIKQGLDDAKTNKDVLQNTNQEYEKALSNARREADRIFQEGKKEAEGKRLIMLEDAKREVAVLIENGKKNLENEKTRMVEEAKSEIVSLSVQIAEKILKKKIDGNFDEESIKDLNNI